jgi:hypothetical protein
MLDVVGEANADLHRAPGLQRLQLELQNVLLKTCQHQSLCTQIPMSNPTHLELIHSYRHMYRALLRAVQYSKPARYIARDQLGEAYRKGQPSNFDSRKITRTLEFLGGAARERGLEHKIVRNLLLTRYHHEKK